MRCTKGFTLMELAIVILILSIMASLAMPMYADYTRKSKTSEVPTLLKSLAETQIGFYEAETHYAAELLTLGWKTNKGLVAPNRADGSYYFFSVAPVNSCNPGSGDAPVVLGLAMADALYPESVPSNYITACMDIRLSLETNTPN